MDIKSVIKNTFSLVRKGEFTVLLRLIDYYINIKILKRKEIARKVNGYPMVMTFQEEGISRDLVISRRREIAETEIVKRIVKPGMCILEIGANIGYYTILMGKLVGKNGKIYAYEPYPPSVDTLARNVKLNNLTDTVKVRNFAVSSENTTQKLYLGRASNVHSLVNLKTGNNNANYIEVKTKDIKEILIDTNRKIDLIRMDIEGHERELFNRLSKDVSPFLPDRIFFEIHPLGDIDPDPTFKEPFENILKLGYYPELVVAALNENTKERFEKLNYSPSEAVDLGVRERYLYNNIKAADLFKVAASRPKMTRAVLLKRK
jgi:FkbM family methyltransferase